MKLAQKIAVAYVRASLNFLAVFSKKRAARKAFKIFCTPVRGTNRKSPAVFQKAEKLQFSIENKKVAGYRWSHPQPKKFLILHGFHSSSKNFDRYVLPMVKKGYEVLAFDAPAHGESEGKQINVVQYRHMIEEIVNRFGPIDAYMAHSFGGLAVSLALEKIHHTKETRLALIAPATETSTAVDSLFNFLQLNKDVRKEFDDLIIQIGGQPLHWYSITRALSNIQASVLWVHDENDDVTPLMDVQPIIGMNYPNIEFLITQGWGHRRIYRENKVVKAVLAFL